MCLASGRERKKMDAGLCKKKNLIIFVPIKQSAVALIKTGVKQNLFRCHVAARPD